MGAARLGGNGSLMCIGPAALGYLDHSLFECGQNLAL